jgi:uncharacterized protein YidB (DUF937 family)
MVSGQMKALLGVLAIAGYQNRDKIAEVLRGLQKPQTNNPDSQQQDGLGGLLGGLTSGSRGGGLGDLLGGLSAGGILGGGLGDLLKTFQQNGHGDKAESWVKPGPNADINDQQLAQAIGPDVLEELASKTGLSHQEILSRLSRDLPKAVDDLTPDGKLPDEKDSLFGGGSTNPGASSSGNWQI